MWLLLCDSSSLPCAKSRAIPPEERSVARSWPWNLDANTGQAAQTHFLLFLTGQLLTAVPLTSYEEAATGNI